MIAADSPLWELGGYAMWLAGSALFAIVSYRNGDTLTFIGSVLFFVGILAVMVPMSHAYQQRRNQGPASSDPIATLSSEAMK